MVSIFDLQDEQHVRPGPEADIVNSRGQRPRTRGAEFETLKRFEYWFDPFAVAPPFKLFLPWAVPTAIDSLPQGDT